MMNSYINEYYEIPFTGAVDLLNVGTKIYGIYKDTKVIQTVRKIDEVKQRCELVHESSLISLLNAKDVKFYVKKTG